jgi:hypothetical protein
MSRDLTASTLAASIAAANAPIFLLKLALDGGTIGFHSRLGALTYDGQVYTGAGSLASIGAVREAGDMSRPTLEVGLSGLNISLVSIIFGQHYQGRSATLYGGFINLETNVLITSPAILFEGKIDNAQIEKSSTTASITLRIENEFADWERPRVRRYNNADQQSRYPTDKFFSFAEQAATKTVYWGRKSF